VDHVILTTTLYRESRFSESSTAVRHNPMAESAVESEHYFRVSQLGVLVHNLDCYREGWLPRPEDGWEGSKPNSVDWGFNHPVGDPAGFADKHGVPMPPGADPSQPDWIVGGHFTPESQGASVGPSPGIDPNKGGGIEISTGKGGVVLDWFHMPWWK
jgi:hypothetical protein